MSPSYAGRYETRDAARPHAFEGHDDSRRTRRYRQSNANDGTTVPAVSHIWFHNVSHASLTNENSAEIG
jgi:hypothetical protein